MTHLPLNAHRVLEGSTCDMAQAPSDSPMLVPGRATPPTEPAAQPTVTPKQWQFLLDAERSLNGVLQRRIAALEAAAVPPARDVLTAIMRAAESAKEPCGMDPESPAAIRNSKFATIAHMAAQGLGMVRGPAFEAAAVPTSAAVPVEVVSREHYLALREAHCMADMDAYFTPRPVHDGAMQRRAFEEGFTRGYERGAALQAAEPAAKKD